MNDDKLELLIGKLLDGEISSAEKRCLDNELQCNEQARELLAQLQVLNECSRQAVACDILGKGDHPQEVFERAWRSNRGGRWRRIIRADGPWRFAAGLAAGFLLGVLLHFALTWGDSADPVSTTQPVADRNLTVGGQFDGQIRGVQPPTVPVMRNVDWYTFTDQTGNQWLVEGVREGAVMPVAYHGDL
jgi:hypothetical protein